MAASIAEGTGTGLGVVYLRVPADLRYRDVAMRTVAAAARIMGPRDDMPGDWGHEVVSAFGEAFNNVILHGHPDGRGDLEIEIEQGDDCLSIRILDHGASFDPMSIPAPDLDSLPEGGLGVYIMRACMDEVTYQAGRPNVLEMVKRVHGTPALPVAEPVA